MYYRPNNVAICLSGDLDFDNTIKIIDAYFGKWEPKEIPAPDRYEQQDLKAHKDTVVYGKEAPEVWMAWKMPDIKHKDIDALEVMDMVLKNGKCGLVDLDIEQKQQLLSCRAWIETAGDFSTYFMVGSPKEKQSLEDVRQIMLAEIEKLKKGEFDQDMLKGIIRNKKRSELRHLQDNEARVMPFITAHIYQIPYEDIVNDLARKEKITKDDVVRVANKYFNDNYVCVLKEHNENANPPKMDKPEITPIEMNRNVSSEFYDQLMVQVKFVPSFLFRWMEDRSRILFFA
jgi:predicted Zn-dependent peptidase